MIVCILGMHRSGTSVTARILNLLGVYLGSDEYLIGPQPDNPKGFWEHREIVEINKGILGGPGRDIKISPGVTPKWTQGGSLEAARLRARSVIDREFADVELWGWKDPRTSLTLSFWQELLPDMHYVICLRHPLSSAQSLLVRDGLPLEEGVYSWLMHVKSALEQTQHEPQLLVAYEDVMSDWFGTLRRFATFIGHPERADQRDIQQAVEDFIDPDLRHDRTQAVAVPEMDLSAGIVSKLGTMYQTLRKGHYGQEVVSLLDSTLAVVQPEVARRRDEASEHRKYQIRLVYEEVTRLSPEHTTVILVGQNELGNDSIPRRRIIPFLEQDGQYWGPPPDDKTAIRELMRLRRAGAHFIVFAWTAFWWLDFYAEFHDYLRSEFPCILEDARLVAFDLRAQQ